MFNDEGKRAELEGAGGEAPKKKRGRPPKSDSAVKVDKATKRARAAVSDAMADPDDLDAKKAAVRIVKRWDAWQKTTGELHDTNVQIRNRTKAAEAAFKAAMEEGIQVNDREAASIKLDTLVTRWQDWQEAISQGTEERKESREKRTKAQKALERSIEEGRQLTLPGASED